MVFGVAIWFIYGYLVYFSRFGILYQEKSGNPAAQYSLKIGSPYWF
jgi:hypothetical protein